MSAARLSRSFVGMTGALTYAAAAQHQSELRASAEAARRARRGGRARLGLPAAPRLRRWRRAYA
jgi:hypothetical protein